MPLDIEEAKKKAHDFIVNSYGYKQILSWDVPNIEKADNEWRLDIRFIFMMRIRYKSGLGHGRVEKGHRLTLDAKTGEIIKHIMIYENRTVR